MPAEATLPAPMMQLRELVQRYRTLAGEFGKEVPLAAFGLSPAETERLFSSYDEDYHINRFFRFSDAGDAHVPTFSINGVISNHVAIAAEIQEIL